jgi:hypothetical protein
MLGDDGECCHDVSLLLSVVEARVAAAYFANLSASCSQLAAAGIRRELSVALAIWSSGCFMLRSASHTMRA